MIGDSKPLLPMLSHSASISMLSSTLYGWSLNGCNSERGILAGIYGIYDGLYPNRGTSYESLSDIRDSHIWIEINDPVFMEDSTGQIHVKIKDDWYKASGVPEHRVLDFQTKKDGQNFYKFKPEFHTSKFRIEFNAIRADILSGNPDRIDYQDIYNKLSKKEYAFMVVLTVVVTVAFYFVLKTN